MAWQRRVLDLVPFPHETEQGFQGRQGSYTGQGSLVHARVPFSHTLQTDREAKIKVKSNNFNILRYTQI